MVASELDVVSINLGRRLALLTTGEIVALTNFFDDELFEGQFLTE